MDFVSFIKNLFSVMDNVENNIKSGFKFSQSEMKEIMSICKRENVKYIESLSRISNLKYFDISFLLSKVNLNDEKIEIIKEAAKLYNEEEFSANGQTCSDFIFRVAANLEYLNMENIEIFKELVKCKNEIYDFKNILSNPIKYVHEKKESNFGFAFQKICMN